MCKNWQKGQILESIGFQYVVGVLLLGVIGGLASSLSTSKCFFSASSFQTGIYTFSSGIHRDYAATVTTLLRWLRCYGDYAATRLTTLLHGWLRCYTADYAATRLTTLLHGFTTKKRRTFCKVYVPQKPRRVYAFVRGRELVFCK